MENEEWRDVPGYEGYYQVSNLGRVKRIKPYWTRKCGVLKGGKDRKQYTQVTLSKNGKHTLAKVHRLVAQAFIPNPENKPMIDHIDGNRGNNSVKNLRWCTMKENANNPITVDRYRKRLTENPLTPWLGKFGVQNSSAKPIYCIELQKVFFGAQEANRLIGIHYSCISSVIHGKRKTAGGYHWRYATEEEIISTVRAK